MRVSLDCKPIALQFTRTVPSLILRLYVCMCACNNLTCIWTNSRGKRCSHAANLSLSFASSRPLCAAPSNFTSHPFRFLPQNRSRFFNFNFFLSFDALLSIIAQSKFFLFLYFNKVSVREKIKGLFLFPGWIALFFAFNQRSPSGIFLEQSRIVPAKRCLSVDERINC